jgi:hypothetical protein
MFNEKRRRGPERKDAVAEVGFAASVPADRQFVFGVIMPVPGPGIPGQRQPYPPASHVSLFFLSMMGLPAIYYHSLVGSRGSREGFLRSGIKRRINREKLDLDTLESQLREGGHLRNLAASRYRKLLALRKELPAFHPNSPQEVLRLRPELFALLWGRRNNGPLAVPLDRTGRVAR